MTQRFLLEKLFCWIAVFGPLGAAMWYWHSDPLGYVDSMQRVYQQCELGNRVGYTARLLQACQMRLNIDAAHVFVLLLVYLFSFAGLNWSLRKID